MFKKKLYLSLLMIVFASNRISSMEIDKSNLFVPEKLGKIRLFHKNNDFYVLKDKKLILVQNCFVDRKIRNISSEKLSYILGTTKDIVVNGKKITLAKISKEQFKKLNLNVDQDAEKLVKIKLTNDEVLDILPRLCESSYIAIKQLAEGEYCLILQDRLPGGGPITGAIGYWLVKTISYGTAVGAAGAIVVGTGGMAGAVTGATAALVTAGAPVGASVVGSAIAGGGLATEAAVVTAGAVANLGGAAAAVAAVESAATGVGLILSSIPFLP